MPGEWDDLQFYESIDFVKRFYRSRHDEDVETNKAREIVAHMAQGRQYFESARDAEELIRPLLLYYGVLSLSRGLILFLDPDARETTLKSAHGLRNKGWSGELQGTLRGLADIRIEIQGGTFTELCRVTKNIERAIIYRAPFPNKAMLTQLGTSDVPTRSTLSLKDVIGRLPDLADRFERTFEAHTFCSRGFVFMLSEKAQTDIDIFETSLPLLEEQSVREIFGFTEDVQIRRSGKHNFLGDLNHLSIRVQHSSLEDMVSKIPLASNDEAGWAFLIHPLKNGLRLSTLSLCFIASYALGMLVRYYPSQWSRLMGQSEEDVLLPIIRSTISLIESITPGLLLAEFRGGIKANRPWRTLS